MEKKKNEKSENKMDASQLKGDDYPFELEEEDYVEMVWLYFKIFDYSIQNITCRLILRLVSGILLEVYLTVQNLLVMETGRLRADAMIFENPVITRYFKYLFDFIWIVWFK